jgi:class 3 adenylate cyclase
MNVSEFKLFDVIVLLVDLPQHGLIRGHEGTIVEILGDQFLVEFSDDNGKEFAMPVLRRDQMLRVLHEPLARSA